MANALTALRVLLTVPFAFLMTRGDRWSAAPAGIVLVAAIATDLLDGVVARRRATDTSAGGVFDHAADCLFVTAGLAAGAVRGVFPWMLALLVPAAFAQYVVDSYWGHRGRALRTSGLGRWNGVLYFEQLAGRPPEKQEPDGGVEQDEEVVLDEAEGRHLAGSLGEEDHPEDGRHRA